MHRARLFHWKLPNWKTEAILILLTSFDSLTFLALYSTVAKGKHKTQLVFESNILYRKFVFRFFRNICIIETIIIYFVFLGVCDIVLSMSKESTVDTWNRTPSPSLDLFGRNSTSSLTNGSKIFEMFWVILKDCFGRIQRVFWGRPPAQGGPQLHKIWHFWNIKLQIFGAKSPKILKIRGF